MIQLIKADLVGILTLFGKYRPQLYKDTLEMDLRRLKRCEDRDYLFLACGKKSYLFPISEVYTADSYACLCWTSYLARPGPHVDALYLHISRIAHGWPFGSITILDYVASAKDVDHFTILPEKELQVHIQKTVKSYRHHAKICSVKDFIEQLKKEGDAEWM